MMDHIALLNLYREWGVDEALVSLCTNHLENVKQTVHKSPIKQNFSSLSSSQKDLSIQLQNATNLNEICEIIQSSKASPLHDTAMHSVLPKGNPEGKYFIIGEVPDHEEDRSGYVFAGRCEAWIKQLLSDIEIPFDQCLRIPLIPWRPPGGRPPSDQELQNCLPFLYRILEIYNPELIITMGVRPTRVLMGSSAPIGRLRGRWQKITLPEQKKTLLLFPMRHPSQLDVSVKARQETWHDLLLIRKFINDNTS